jgi:hypothetical protein
MMSFFRNSTVVFLVFFMLDFFSHAALASDPEPLLKFIENKNQWLSRIQFAANIPGGSMTISPGMFSYHFLDNKKLQELHQHSHEGVADGALDHTVRGHSVQAIFQNANLNSVPLPFGQSSEYYNYYLGNDPQHWASKAFAYEGMMYPSLYEGIDLKIYSSGINLKYDFIVAPYADPSRISVKYEGADDIGLDNGNLVLKTSLAELIEKRPVAFQYIDGKKVLIECRYELVNNILSFCFPEGYDPCAALIIDPLLIFSTFSGSTADNWGSTATPGEHGNLYSAGVTRQLNPGEFYPTTPGVFQTTSGGLYDIGVLKYDSTGSRLLYSTYLGGSQSESAHSLVMNANEELIILGTTSSGDFPTTDGASDRSFNGGVPVTHVISYANGSDLFIARIAKDGRQLIASTFLGGSDNDGLNPNRDPNNTALGFPLTKNYGDELRGDIIADDSGNLFLTSVTLSHDFPVMNSFSSTFKGGATDGIVIKLNADLSGIVWSSYLGGSGVDAAHTIKLDSEGNIFVAGGTTSTDFPITSGSYQQIFAGVVDGWIAKIAADGSAILSCTFTGTSQFDQVYFLDLNKDDQPFVYGQTSSSKFPVMPGGVYSNPRSGQFIQKFNNALTAIHFSTVFGSGRGNSETTTPDISPTAFLVNDCNNIFVSGWGGGALNGFVMGWINTTIGLPVTQDAFQRVSSGHDFYFMVLADDASQLLYGTYFGGSQSLTHVDGGTCRFDKNGIVYHAVCSGCNTDGLGPKSDFPTTPGAWSNTNESGNCNNAAFKFDLSSLRAIIQTNTEDFSSPGIRTVCMPDAFVLQNFSIGGEIFEWDLGDGTRITKFDTANFSHTYKEPGQYLVKLKAIDRGTCRGVDSTATLVTVFKAESEVQDDDALCEGDPYTLKATGGAVYSWTSEDSGFSSSLAQPVVSPTDTMKYYIVLTERNGCVRKDTVQLNVVPAMTPDFRFHRVSGCDDRSAIRVTNLTDSVKSGDNLFVDWGDGNTSDQPEALHRYEKDGVYQLKLIATREFCVYEKVVHIPVFKITLPNVITPGAPEGKNDTFTVQFGEIEGATPGDHGFKVDLTVYNRWGTVLLQQKDYQYDWSGEDLSPGIYYFEVSIQDHTTCKSWLQLIK